MVEDKIAVRKRIMIIFRYTLIALLLSLCEPSCGDIISNTKDLKPCSLVWPKFGDVYPDQNLVYFLFYCHLSEKQESMLKVEKGYMNIGWNVQSYQANTGMYTNVRDGTQRVYANPEPKMISRDFKFSLFQDLGPWAPLIAVKFTMQISIGGEVIDVLSTVVSPGSDEFLEGMIGKEKTFEDKGCFDIEDDRDTCEPKKHYDFIEIGTSGFDTLLEKALNHHVGLSIEPLKHLQDVLPNRDHVQKISCAIGDTSGWRDIYYLPNYFLEHNGISLIDFSEAQFLYGIGRVGEMSPNVFGRIGSSGWIMHYLLHAKRQIIRMKTVPQICKEYGVADVTLMKLDCEGFDYKIMNSALDYFIENAIKLPVFIEFENNSNYHAAGLLVDRLIELGYIVYSFFYEVTNPVHDSSINAPHGVVYAELCPENRDHEANVRANEVTSLIPTDLLWGRELCATYHNRSYSETPSRPEGATMMSGYFCSILLSEERSLLSIKDLFIVL